MVSYKELTETSSKQGNLPSEDYIPKVMPPILGTFDMTATFVVAIYLVSCATTLAAVGPAGFTYLLLGTIVFFIPCLIATAQLGVLFPYEGSLYNWTHKVLGGYWSFFSGFCAWFPGVLISSSLADLFVTYIQGMHSSWLGAPWQQGLVISAVLIFSGIVAIQRFRTVQNVINGLVCLVILASFLIMLSGIVWLATGHHSATDFSHWTDWGVKPDNYVLFGLTAFAYIGTEGPLNMAGEIIGRRVITRHLLWGSLLILVFYLTNTFAVLVVQGQNAAYNPFAMVTTVDMVLGKVAGSITAVCLMGSFIATVLVYNYVFARLLLVASVDRRLPNGVGRLNKHRVPANAIIFQTILAVIFTILAFIVVPLVSPFGNPTDLSVEVYSVSQAAAALVWAISASFLFVDLVGCYLRSRQSFLQQRLFPIPILWASAILGSVACVLTIIDTLLYSWIPQISNSNWWFIVGGLTLVFLVVAAIGSMFATSEAAWEDLEKGRS
jgi:amino acid transporter